MNRVTPSLHPPQRYGKAGRLPRWLWVVLLAIFPLVVGVYVWRTLEMLQDQRALYLRGQVAALAARVESLDFPAGEESADWAGALYEDEPSLVDAMIVNPEDADAVANEIYAGRELYRLQTATRDGVAVMRAWFPVHRGGDLRVVRLDFAASAADFLTAYATQSIALVTLIAMAMMALSAYTFHLAGIAARLERRQAEREHLAQLGEMAAVLAHEIRNPLGSIKGFGQLLEESVPPRERGFASEIVEQTARLERLVEDLLHFGRVPEPRFAPAPWNELAGRLEADWAQHRINDDARSNAAKLHVERNDLILATDAALLEQALANLIRNARHAVEAQPAEPARKNEAQADGRVEVTLAWVGSAIEIAVADDGPGLSEEAQARLFEPFFTTKAAGTGLGLAISRKLVAALGGELILRNRSGGGLLAPAAPAN
ncbi:MAG: ATP-binding protein [Bryobacterales bacterium]|nr:ATP-binding protein [Bryobacterales bacterium]